ncbi:MAG: type II toxin-antitoxin system RelE/ParE family toxin [Klebsiella grimontii]|nr:type II toxin-antitoxin system RelE/ParE family toxin [Klebsiella grimontii]
MWDVETTEVFDKWFEAQIEALKEDMLAAMVILSEYGPQLGRPFADTVNDSAFSGIVLCAGDKTGLNEKRFYKDMIKLADAEYRKHLNQ